MVQNILNDTEEEVWKEEEEEQNSENQSRIKQILKNTFTLNNSVIYVISLMVSLVGGEVNSVFTQMAPFGFAIVAGALSGGVPLMMVCLLTAIGTTIKFGASGLLGYILTMLVFLALVLIKRPLQQEDKNEQMKVGMQMAVSVFLVQLVKILFKGFLLYDLLYSIMLSISTYLLYKIFVNALPVFTEYKVKKVFSIEEVMGASLLIAISINCLGTLSIFGYSIRNILSILVVLVMGWKNGMLVGATTGITIGTTLGLLNGQDPTMLAAYAISGLIAGVLNKLGKIGVVVGFIVGNIVLSYLANGNTIEIIKFQEILIAALGLLAIPKTYKLEISNIISDAKLLPETTTRTLEENKETINKLETMSNAISQIAREYEKTRENNYINENIDDQNEENKKIFKEELFNNLEGKEENLLYDDIYNDNEQIVDEIFEVLSEKEVLTRKDIINIFAGHNNYILGFNVDCKEDDYVAKNDIDEILKVVNYSYKVSKMNFIWKKKIDENKKTISSQLSNVSEAISNLATQINTEEDKFISQKEQIRAMLEDKDIKLKDITIKQDETGKYFVNVYTSVCQSSDGTECSGKTITKVLSKILKDKVILQKQKCGLRLNDSTCTYTYTSDNKFNIQVGIAKAKKSDSIISGDTTLQTRLEDGKYLLAISDGMGSGPEARKSSKIAIKMLERLLTTGFNKDTALKLINNTISDNTDEDMYATLDVNILDLYNGNMEFIKNGACPTFVKRNGKVEVLKAVSLPTGILDNIDLVEYNYELQDGDIILMCSDGILDSNKEYASKELWVQEVLEEIETDDAQRISDIILSEARDNDFGKEKDDMTVIVCKINKK